MNKNKSSELQRTPHTAMALDPGQTHTRLCIRLQSLPLNMSSPPHLPHTLHLPLLPLLYLPLLPPSLRPPHLHHHPGNIIVIIMIIQTAASL